MFCDLFIVENKFFFFYVYVMDQVVFFIGFWFMVVLAFFFTKCLFSLDGISSSLDYYKAGFLQNDNGQPCVQQITRRIHKSE